MAGHTELVEALVRQLQGRKEAPYVVSEMPTADGYGRYDVLAVTIAHSFRTVVLAGYEVKHSRADLMSDLADEKWRKYLPYVDRFYFAVRQGIAKLEEIPREAGVITWIEEKGVWRATRKPTALDPAENREQTLLKCLQRDRWSDHSRVLGFGPKTREERIRAYAEMEQTAQLAQLVNIRVKEMIMRAESSVENIKAAEEAAAAKLRAADGLSELLTAATTILSHAQRAVAGVNWNSTAGDDARAAIVALAETLNDDIAARRNERLDSTRKAGLDKTL